MTDLTCPGCGIMLTADNTEIVSSHLIKCNRCGEVMESTVRHVSGKPHPPSKPPQGLSIAMRQTDMIITFRWLTWWTPLLVAFTLFAEGYLLIAIMKHSPHSALPADELAVLTFLIMLFLLMAYFMIAGLVNRTEIRISPTYLSMRNYPLKFPGGDKTVPMAEIDAVGCERHAKQPRLSEPPTVVTYRIVLELKSGKRLIFLSLTDWDRVVYIANQIEDHVNMQAQEAERSADLR